MNLIFWGKGERGRTCLEAFCAAGIKLQWAVTQPAKTPSGQASLEESAARLGVETVQFDDPNGPEAVRFLSKLGADLFILAGYGAILKPAVFNLPKHGTINTHAGRLPQYRGSSPMNWALINGEKSFTLSIIRVDAGVDTGDVLLERNFPIGEMDTIRDLHAIANRQFPEMLIAAVRAIERGGQRPRKQDPAQAAYYPLRFPEDGLILWDQLTAGQVHNRIRALTDPYPGAFTYFDGKKISLLASELREQDHFGEPGRVYRITDRGLLVCARDKCLWITRTSRDAEGTPPSEWIKRYDRFATVAGLLLKQQGAFLAESQGGPGPRCGSA